MPFTKAKSEHDKGLLVFYVTDKWFAFVNVDIFDFCNLKSSPESSINLQEKYEGVKPGYHMNKKNWISIYFHQDVPDDKIRELVKTSYELVVANLPKKEVAKLESKEEN